MYINITHTKMPKMKRSDYADIVGMLSETSYQIMQGVGYDMSFVPLGVIYAVSVISKTGSSILKKMEDQELHPEESEAEDDNSNSQE